jgi:hypothetical protein
MTRPSEARKADESLKAEKALVEAALKNTSLGPRRHLIECALRRIETALENGRVAVMTAQSVKLPG